MSQSDYQSALPEMDALPDGSPARNISPKLHDCLERVQNFSNIPVEFKFDHKNFNKKDFLHAFEVDDRSPKLRKLFENIKALDDDDVAKEGKLYKHYIFSDVTTRGAGARMITSAFFAKDFKCAYNGKKFEFAPNFTDVDLSAVEYPYGRHSFAFLPGGTCWQQEVPIKLATTVTSVFNMPENKHGAFIRFLILDSKYKEAIDLKDVKYCHLFDPLNTADEKQAVGRGARNCGQANIKFTKDGWKLHVYKYNLEIPDKVMRQFHLKGDNMLQVLSDAKPNVDPLQKKMFPKLMLELDWIGMKIAVDRLLTENIHTAPMRGGALLRNKKQTVTAADERAYRLANRSRRKARVEVSQMRRALLEKQEYERHLAEKYTDFKRTPTQLVVLDKYKKMVLKKYAAEPANGCRVSLKDLPTLTVEKLEALRASLNPEFDAALLRGVESQLLNAQNVQGTLTNPTPGPLSQMQRFIQAYVTPDMPTKGILLWHSAGSGKTCAAISMASTNFVPKGYSVIWVTRTNLIKGVAKNVYGKDPTDLICDAANRAHIRNKNTVKIDKYAPAWCGGPIGYQSFSNFLHVCEDPKPTKKTNYTFYKSYMKSVPENQERRATHKTAGGDPLYKCLVIIDEAHKLYNEELPSNEEPDLLCIEEMIKNSYAVSGKDSVRVVLMTATPYTYSPLEFFKLMNLLRPDDDLLPVTLPELRLTGEGRMPDALTARLDGYISYVDVSKDKSRFAQIVETNLSVEMSAPKRPEETISKEALDAAKEAKELVRDATLTALGEDLKKAKAETTVLTREYKKHGTRRLALDKKVNKCIGTIKTGKFMDKSACMERVKDEDAELTAATEATRTKLRENAAQVRSTAEKQATYKASLKTKLMEAYAAMKKRYAAQTTFELTDPSQVGELIRCSAEAKKTRKKEIAS